MTPSYSEHQKSSYSTAENVGNTSLLTNSTNQVYARGSDGVVHSINNSSGTAIQRSYSNGWEILGVSDQWHQPTSLEKTLTLATAGHSIRTGIKSLVNL